MHRRLFPVSYRFVYRVFSLLLDIDRLPGTAARLRLFSHNRFNLMSLHDRDHGPRDGTPLRPWIERQLRGHGIDLQGGPVLLLCFPRILGYAFNPLSLWYCHHRDGTLRAVLCEVRNTFGEMHGYLLHDDGAAMGWPVRAGRRKVFHVSPFISMHARYEFLLTCPGDRLGVCVHEYQDDRLLLVATQRAAGRPLTDAAIASALARYPLMTFEVMAMIHWQALKIWLKGATFYPKPSPPEREVT
jgi:DUF1365 family protein